MNLKTERTTTAICNASYGHTTHSQTVRCKQKNSDESQLSEIADLLLCGQLCFVNKIDGSIEHFPQRIDLFMDEKDPWKEIKDKIDRDFLQLY